MAEQKRLELYTSRWKRFPTHLVDVRIENDVTGIAPMRIPLFAKRCATVHARGVKLGSGPVPNAN